MQEESSEVFQQAYDAAEAKNYTLAIALYNKYMSNYPNANGYIPARDNMYIAYFDL